MVLSCCPPNQEVLLPPAACSLAPCFSSPLMNQLKRIVFCWISKLDRLTPWFEVVQERVWTSGVRSQGEKIRTTRDRTVSWLSHVMSLHLYYHSYYINWPDSTLFLTEREAFPFETGLRQSASPECRLFYTKTVMASISSFCNLRVQGEVF